MAEPPPEAAHPAASRFDRCPPRCSPGPRGRAPGVLAFSRHREPGGDLWDRTGWPGPGPGPVRAGVCLAEEGPGAAEGSTSRGLKPGPGGGEPVPGKVVPELPSTRTGIGTESRSGAAGGCREPGPLEVVSPSPAALGAADDPEYAVWEQDPAAEEGQHPSPAAGGTGCHVPG